MKHLKLFFALFAMLALGVGNAWGAEKTITLTYSDFGLTNSYAEKTATVDGIGFTVNQGYKGSGKVIQMNNSKGAGVLYNTTSIAGLKSIKVNVSSGSKTYTITSGTAQTPSGNSQTGTATKTFSIPSGDTYFQLKVSGASYFSSIVITYDDSNSGGETPGTGGETPEPDPEPDPTPGTGGTVTYTVSSVTEVTTTGNVPQGSTAVLSGTGSLLSGFIQCSNGKNHTLTLTGYEGYMITGVTIHVKSNSSKGTGSFSVMAGSTTIASITESAFNTSSWNGSWNTTGVDKTLTMTNDSYEIQSGENVTLTISCKSGGSAYNSLYVKSYTITYKPVTSSGGGTEEPAASLTANPTSLDFGSVANESSNEKSLTVSGQNLTEDVTLSIDGTYKAFFSVAPTTITKADEISQEIVVTYTPTTEGSHTGTLIIKSGEITKNVTLSGKSFVLTGAGTEEKPYTTTDIITLGLNDKTQAWVEGYIVGVMEDNEFATSTTKTSTNIVLADAADATENYVPVALPSGNIRTALNVLDNSSNLGKKVAVYGSLETYFSLPGVKNVSEYKWIVEEGELAAPTITPAGGTYYAAQNVSISAEEGTTIYYTLDGTSPTTGSNVYSTPISIAETATLKAIAVKGEKTSPVASENYTINLPLTTMDAIFAKATAVGNTATSVKVVMDNWVVTGATTKNAYVTDGTKGFIIYRNDGHGFNVGDVLFGAVICKVQLYKGSAELTELTSTTEGLTVSTGGVVTPVELNAAGIAALGGVNTGSVIKITGPCTVDGTKYYVAGVQLFKSLYTYTNPEDGYNYECTGVYLQCNTTKEILPRKAEDLVKIETQQPAGIKFETTEYTANVNETFTAPTLTNPNGLTVTYSTSDATLATVNTNTGAVTIGNKTGKVTITASFAGNEDYVAATASYNITISDPNLLEATFVAGTDKSEELSISKNGVTVEFTGGTFSRDDNYRCYANQSMTISYNDGQITKIVLAKSSDNSKTPSNFTTEQGTYAYAGSEGVWTGEAKSVTFETTTQVQMNTITVYYKQDTRTAAGLAWNPATVSLTVGDAFTAPTFSNPNNLTGITFASDNEALATVTNAGAISLVSGKTGTATITATYAGNETYKAAEVKCTISVNPKTENVVILAQYAGNWYALKAETGSSTNSLAALEVEYINGVLYNVDEADKASITWKRTIVGNFETFQYGDKYLKGSSSTNLFMEDGTEGKYQWDKDTHTMLIVSTNRTFLYQGTYFKNYAISNAGRTVDGTTYSALPVVTAAKFETATFYTRTVTPGNYGTICLPYAVNNFTGATFYKVAGTEGNSNKIVFDEVTELEAGKPYIFMAEAAEIKLAQVGEYTENAQLDNSLQGTFDYITDGDAGAPGNILEGNYMVVNNVIKMCGARCKLPENRAYFVAEKLENLTPAPASMPGRRRVTMGVTGENEATGVDNITENGVIAPKKYIENGQLVIIRGGEKFNAQGQKL